MLKMTRLAALAVVLSLAWPSPSDPAGRTGADTAPPAPHLSATPPAAPPRPPPRRGLLAGREGDGSRRQPLWSRSALERRWSLVTDSTRHPRHHVDGQLVHHHHQGVRAGQDEQGGASRGKILLERAFSSRRCRRPEEDQPVPLHRRDPSRSDGQARWLARQCRHETNGSRCRSSAPSTRCPAGRRTDSLSWRRSVRPRRSVQIRHGLGDLSRARRPSALPDRRRSTRWRARWARR